MVPLVTTTVRVARLQQDGPYTNKTYITVCDKANGHISGVTGTSTNQGGIREVGDAKLLVEVDVALKTGDRIEDLTSSDVWDVLWVRRRFGLGLDYLEAGLQEVTNR